MSLPPSMSRFLPRSASARRHALEAILAAAALALVAGLALGTRIDPSFSTLDGATVEKLNQLAGGVGNTVMRAIADAAASNTVLAVTVVVALILAAHRHWHGALALAVSVGASQGIVAIVKHVVARDRPAADDAIVHAAGYSFPSAHSATSVALYGVIALIAAHELRGRVPRATAIAGAAALCLAVGVSRVYLGAHYPTDVLAGWLLGCVIALGSWRGALALRGRAALATS